MIESLVLALFDKNWHQHSLSIFHSLPALSCKFIRITAVTDCRLYKVFFV